MSTFLRFEIKRVITDKSLWVLILLLSFIPVMTYFSFSKVEFGRYTLSSYQLSLDSLSQNIGLLEYEASLKEPGRGREAQQALDSMKYQVALLSKVAYLPSGSSDIDRINATLDYEKYLLNDMKKGRILSGSLMDQEARVKGLELMLESPRPQVFDTVEELPLTSFLMEASIFEILPSIFLILAPVLIFSLVFSPENINLKDLPNMLPISNIQIVLSRSLIGLLLSVFSAPLILLPISILLGINNGIGELGYSVVKAGLDGSLVILSSAGFLLKSIVLFTAALFFIGAVVLFISRFTYSRVAITISSLAVLGTSTLPIVAKSSFGAKYAHLIPLTYIEVMRIPVRHVSDLQAGLSLLANSSQGLIVLLASGVILSAISIILVLFKSKI